MSTKRMPRVRKTLSPNVTGPPQTTGSPSPIGATWTSDGVNFCLFSRTATGVELLLFDHVDDAKPARVIRFDPVANRTYHYWHVFVPGLQPGQIYGYRVLGPHDPATACDLIGQSATGSLRPRRRSTGDYVAMRRIAAVTIRPRR